MHDPADRSRRAFSRGEAKRFYDRIGSWIDLQGVFENRALDALLAHSAFGQARAVFELGCGTGRLGALLLSRHLPGDARYEGVDLSETMVRLATERLRPWAGRARVRLTDGSLPTPHAPGSFDRFVSTYVLDLLSNDDIRIVLGEAARLLAPDGQICLASLTRGPGGASRLLTAAWSGLNALNPWLVGGCRPIALRDRLLEEGWGIRHDEVVIAFGVPSEVVVASAPPSCRTAG